MLKLLKHLDYNSSGVHVFEMKDGEVAEIVEWAGSIEYHGRIIQRYKNNLIALGMVGGNSWPSFFDVNDDALKERSLLVRVFPAGRVFQLVTA